MPKSESEIQSILEREIDNAAGYNSGDLSGNRSDAMDYYLGEPRGDEIEGRSQVISTDVADAIEWIKPQIIETFVASDEIVRFDPVGAEDEEQAEQESDYVNYVVTKENDAFTLFASLTNDALIQKNGYAKVYWDEPDKEREEYRGLNQFELAQLLSEPVEVIEHSEVLTEAGPAHDIAIHRITSPGKVCIEPVPPEEILFNKDHNKVLLKDARFVAHDKAVSASELIEQGYDKALVESLPSYEDEEDEEDYSRRTLSDERDDEAGDTSMRMIRVYECYIRMDQDEDGIAELRQIIYAGKKILSNEEVDRIPFISVTPILQSHKHLGLSIYDRLKQIQDQKTAIWRQLLDNLYLTNNSRTYVQNGQVNLDDLMTNRPGGIVRGKGLYGQVMAPIVTPAVGSQGFQMLEYLDKVREERSGVGPDSMGQSMNLANDTAHGIERIMSAKEKLVGLVIRTFAETGVKDMFLQVRELLMKHQDKSKVIKLRGKWVDVNPAEWRTRMNSTIKVGLGTGDQIKQQGALQRVLEIQKELHMAGSSLVTEKHVYNALDDFAKVGGLNDASPYFLDPNSEEAKAIAQQKAKQPKPVDPQMEAIKAQKEIEQIKAKNQADKLQVESIFKDKDQKNSEREFVLKQQELAAKVKDMEQRFQLELAKAKKGDNSLDIERIKSETEIEKARIAASASMDLSPIMAQIKELACMLNGMEEKREQDKGVVAEYLKMHGSPEVQGVANQIMGGD